MLDEYKHCFFNQLFVIYELNSMFFSPITILTFREKRIQGKSMREDLASDALF